MIESPNQALRRRWADARGHEAEMRRLIYQVACSANGFIAHPDGALDGFPDGDHVADFLRTHQ